MIKIFINGTFDVLHPGHINLFKEAKNKGDFLHVAIDSDKRVSELKGENRPFNNQENRKFILESIRYIDKVSIFYNDDHLKLLIYYYQPDIMMVGSDWKGKNIIGSEYAKQLTFFDRDSRYSTTEILESFINRRQLHR
jgi:D-beta-D-heptose 7-phosphate kinase/D-beta-D-heptose 1-phosphate adenosyltransferase